MADVDGTARYAAFLSYSHKDEAAARWLHHKLESYRIPGRLAGTEGERGKVPERLTPIFRDRDELSVAGDLSEKVRAALAASDSLIVICSPMSASSLWVAKEIATFRELHPGEPVFAAIVDGEPTECFPQGLAAAGVEPLAADLRPGRDGRRLGLLKLVAGISGVRLDSLVQRDAARRIRRTSYVTAAALAAMLIMGLLTAYALNARADAQQQRNEAEGLVEFMLTDLRDRLEETSSLKVLTAVNERALAYYQRQDLRGLSPESLERRARILNLMGEDDQKRGNLDRALGQFREARRTTAALLAADPENPERILAQSQSEYWVGSIDQQRGNYSEAMKAYRRYLEAAVKMYRIAPTNPKYVGEVAYAESNLGAVQLNGFKQPARARSHFEQSLHWFERAARLEPAKVDWRREIADAHAWIADTYFEQKLYPQSRAQRLREAAIKQELLATDRDNRSLLYDMVVATRALGRIDLELDQLRRAERMFAGAQERIEALLALDPRNAMWRDQAIKLHLDKARLFIKRGDPGPAKSALLRVRTILAEEGSARVETEARHILLEQLTKLEARVVELESRA
ncbi:MAG TPA: toll/interleukin-1 receptor domain-containing protein [Allosphingosinicella sp.]